MIKFLLDILIAYIIITAAAWLSTWLTQIFPILDFLNQPAKIPVEIIALALIIRFYRIDAKAGEAAGRKPRLRFPGYPAKTAK